MISYIKSQHRTDGLPAECVLAEEQAEEQAEELQVALTAAEVREAQDVRIKVHYQKNVQGEAEDQGAAAARGEAEGQGAAAAREGAEGQEALAVQEEAGDQGQLAVQDPVGSFVLREKKDIGTMAICRNYVYKGN